MMFPEVSSECWASISDIQDRIKQEFEEYKDRVNYSHYIRVTVLGAV